MQCVQMNSLRATAFHKAQPFLEKFYSGVGVIWEAFPGATIDSSPQEVGTEVPVGWAQEGTSQHFGAWASPGKGSSWIRQGRSCL